MRRINKYIYQLPDWPDFHWRERELSSKLVEVHLRQGHLIGRMESLGFSQRDEAVLKTLTDDVVKSSVRSKARYLILIRLDLQSRDGLAWTLRVFCPRIVLWMV